MTRDDGYTRYTVRIPTPLYKRVKKAAGEKSVNAEIVAALEEKYPSPPPSPISMAELVEAMNSEDPETIDEMITQFNDFMSRTYDFSLRVETDKNGQRVLMLYPDDPEQPAKRDPDWPPPVD